MNKIAPLLCILLGGYWFYMGVTKYNLWVSNGPGGGLFPAVCGLLLIGCGGALLARYAKSGEKTAISRRAVLIILIAVVTSLSIFLIGMIPALGIFIVCWLKFMEKYSVAKSLLIGVGTALFLHVIFAVLLKVPLPMGIFK